MQKVQTTTSHNSFFDVKKRKESLSEQQVDKVKKSIYDNNQFEFVETETRNILLCGRTRSGKTTTMGVLKDPCYSPLSSSIFSETQNPKFQSFSINNRVEDDVHKFTLNIIDSPGLFEVKDKDDIDRERTNEVIAQTIAKCLENEITNIHCIIMFITFEAGINRDDIEAMELFLDMFGGCGVSVCLCITHADKHGDEWREKRKAELLKHDKLASLIEREKMPIVFMGCVDKEDKLYKSEDDLLDDYKIVYKMREILLEYIFGAHEKKLLNQMNVAKKKIESISSVMDIVIHNFKLFASCNDFGTSKIQQSIIQHKENIAYLSENSIYINVPELANKFVAIVDGARRLKNKDMDNKLKTSLLWPLKLRESDTLEYNRDNQDTDTPTPSNPNITQPTVQLTLNSVKLTDTTQHTVKLTENTDKQTGKRRNRKKK